MPPLTSTRPPSASRGADAFAPSSRLPAIAAVASTKPTAGVAAIDQLGFEPGGGERFRVAPLPEIRG